MRLLLDTHAFAWAIANDAKLPDRVAGLITDPASAVWVSAVAIYELEYKRPFDDEIQFLPTDLIAAAVPRAMNGCLYHLPTPKRRHDWIGCIAIRGTG